MSPGAGIAEPELCTLRGHFYVREERSQAGQTPVCTKNPPFLCGKGFTACAPYNGAQWAIGAEGAVCLQEGSRVRIEHKASEGQSRAASVFQRLVSAGKRLLRVIEHNEGGANKDLAKFADQINALCDVRSGSPQSDPQSRRRRASQIPASASAQRHPPSAAGPPCPHGRTFR